MQDLKDTDIQAIATVLLEADKELTSFSAVVRAAIPELLQRLTDRQQGHAPYAEVWAWFQAATVTDAKAQIEAALSKFGAGMTFDNGSGLTATIGAAALPEPEPEPEPEPDYHPLPPEPTPTESDSEFGSAKDRYEEEWHGVHGARIDKGNSPQDILYICRIDGVVPDGLTIYIEDNNVIEGLWIGGGHKYAISNADGSPLKNLRIVFGNGSRVDGLKIGTSKGGMTGELRLVDPTLRPDDRDIQVVSLDNIGDPYDLQGATTFEALKQGDEENIVLEEGEYDPIAAAHDGESQGDFAALRVLDHMPLGFHLVAISTSIEVDHSWTGYDGMGMKWAIFLKGCKATFDGLVADSAREHTVYQNNTHGLLIENGVNIERWVVDPAGNGMMRGNGRTFEQEANRVKQDYPAGGDPSTGAIILINCEARFCGWEGQPAYVDGDGVVQAGNPNAGGGSDFTNHGHTGPVKAILGCYSVEGYAGAIAGWNEVSHKNKSEHNPDGVRCWMVEPEGLSGEHSYDPLQETNGPVDGWGARRLVVRDFEVIGERRDKQRKPFLLSGMRELELSGLSVNGEPVDASSPHIEINHQDGATPVETATIDGEVQA